MEVRMARRYRFSKPVVATFSVALAIAAVAVIYKLTGSSPEDAQASNANVADTGNTTAAGKPIVPDTKLASVTTDTPATQPVRIAVPTAPGTTAATPTVATPPVTTPQVATPPRTTHQPTSPDPAATSASAKALIEQADAKRKVDDLIEARKLLVQAIDTKSLAPAEHDDVLRRLSEINQIVVFSPKKFVSDDTQEQYKVKPGDLMQKIAAQYDITWKFLGRLNGIEDPRKLQVGKSLKIVRGPFHALVDKSDFTLDVYMGKPGTAGAIFLKRFRVGLGEFDSTPTGEWLVDTKLENPRYFNPRDEGPRVIEPDDPKNPLGERWIALTGVSGQAVGKSSYGIHGTIEPDSIGQKKSMGCIRLLNEDVELVYDLLITGKSTVTVVE
jgi:lipoprotein-anchoring transpeptidase ErfK/SrfK